MRLLRSRILTIALALPLMLLAVSGALARTCTAADDAGHCCDHVTNCGFACAGTCQPFSAIEDVAVSFQFEGASATFLNAAESLSGIVPAPELPPPR